MFKSDQLVTIAMCGNDLREAILVNISHGQLAIRSNQVWFSCSEEHPSVIAANCCYRSSTILTKRPCGKN